jgi:site-specific DNA-cytosine methylase
LLSSVRDHKPSRDMQYRAEVDLLAVLYVRDALGPDADPLASDRPFPSGLKVQNDAWDAIASAHTALGGGADLSGWALQKLWQRNIRNKRVGTVRMTAALRDRYMKRVRERGAAAKIRAALRNGATADGEGVGKKSVGKGAVSKKGLVVLSLFDGVACGRVALERAGISVEQYFGAEIDRYAIGVARANYPDIIPLGDVASVRYDAKRKTLHSENGRTWSVPRVDLLLGGPPCQGFSRLGTQAGMADARSSLLQHFVRIKHEVGAVHFLMENVRMSKDHRDEVTKLLGADVGPPLLIDSRLVSAQRRARLYWTGLVGDAAVPPDDRGVAVRDILQSRAEIKRDRDLRLPTEARLGYIRRRVARNFQRDEFLTAASDKAACVCTSDARTLSAFVLMGEERQRQQRLGPRFLSCVEIERLQTMPDNYTCFMLDKNGDRASVSLSRRIMLIGNAWTVDVIVYLLRLIFREE